MYFFRARRSGKHTFSGLKFGVGRVTRKSLFTVKIDPLNPLDIPLDDHIGTLTPDANMYVGVTTSSFSKERGRENTQGIHNHNAHTQHTQKKDYN